MSYNYICDAGTVVKTLCFGGIYFKYILHYISTQTVQTQFTGGIWGHWSFLALPEWHFVITGVTRVATGWLIFKCVFWQVLFSFSIKMYRLENWKISILDPNKAENSSEAPGSSPSQLLHQFWSFNCLSFFQKIWVLTGTYNTCNDLWRLYIKVSALRPTSLL